MKKRKSVLLVIALLLVVVTGGVTMLTYSRYLSTASGTSTAKVAPWVIKVNGTDIVAENSFTFKNIIWSTNQYISDGYIAPSRTGTFDLEIDPSDSKVAVQYKVKIDTTNIDSYPQITVKEVKVGDTTLNAESDGTYTKVIDLSAVESGTKDKVTVTIEWVNADTNNDSDTNIGSTVEDLSIPVTVTASQYLG